MKIMIIIMIMKNKIYWLIDILRVESDEKEVKEGKELKNLFPNKLLNRLPILLAQIKAGSNSYKLKNESDYIFCKYYMFCISTIK